MRTFLGKMKHSASPKEELVCADAQKCVGRNFLVVENWAASQPLVKLCQIAIIKNLICKLGLTLASFGAELNSLWSQQRGICTFGMWFIWLTYNRCLPLEEMTRPQLHLRLCWLYWLLLHWLQRENRVISSDGGISCRYLYLVRWILLIMSKDIRQKLMQ